MASEIWTPLQSIFGVDHDQRQIRRKPRKLRRRALYRTAGNEAPQAGHCLYIGVLISRFPWRGCSRDIWFGGRDGKRRYRPAGD